MMRNTNLFFIHSEKIHHDKGKVTHFLWRTSIFIFCFGVRSPWRTMAITFRNSILENKIVILPLIISDVKVYQASVNQVIIGSGTGMFPVQCQAITWTIVQQISMQTWRKVSQFKEEGLNIQVRFFFIKLKSLQLHFYQNCKSNQNTINIDLVNIGSGNGLLPYSTKALPEPMLTDHS